MTAVSSTDSRPALWLAPEFAPEPAHVELAHQPMDIVFDPAVRRAVRGCHEFAMRRISDGGQVYGATTGFGPMVKFAGREQASDQCDNALAHLGAGQGEDLPAEVVRGAMLVRLWSLCRARSGASVGVVDALAAALRTGFAPAVPRLGSLGASGDLIPLSYIARALRGEGAAYLDGARMAASAALAFAGLTPLDLDGRDALALVNGTSLTAAAAALAIRSLERSCTAALHLTALLAGRLDCTDAFTEPELLDVFRHPGAAEAGKQLRTLMNGGGSGVGRPLQEPYSIRCVPQLVGAAADALRSAENTVRTDLRSVSDNPLFFPEKDLVAHGGNFFGQPIAFAADQMNTVAVQLANLAERQLDLLIDPNRNGGLPPMLASDPGRQHGMQGVQLAATAMVAAMRRAAMPASMQSLPTNWHNQDVIPFGTQAALTALDQARLLRLVHGCLAVSLRQAAYVGQPAQTSNTLLDELCERIEPVAVDRPLDEDVRRAADLLDAHLSR